MIRPMKKTAFAFALAAPFAAALAAATPAAAGVFESDAKEEAAEAAFVASAPHSLLDAVRGVDGAAYEASLETEDGAMLWEIAALSGGETRVAMIDPATGKRVAEETPNFAERLMKGLDDEGDGIAAAKIDMASAIAAAEAASGGKAMEVSFAQDDDHDEGHAAEGPVWAVRSADASGMVSLTLIDASSGATLASGPAPEDD